MLIGSRHGLPVWGAGGFPFVRLLLEAFVRLPPVLWFRSVEIDDHLLWFRSVEIDDHMTPNVMPLANASRARLGQQTGLVALKRAKRA
jgi:hypothetical protein